MKRILLALILIGAAAQAQNLNDVEQLMEKKHFKEALSRAGELAVKAERDGDFTEMIKAKSLMVEACLELGETDKAEEYFNSTIGHFNRKQLYSLSYYGNSQALSQISAIYKERGDIDEARIYARNAISYMNVWDVNNILLIRYSKLAELDMMSGDFEAALRSVETALGYATDKIPIKVRTDLMMQMVVCLEGLGRENETEPIIDDIERLINSASYNPAINSTDIYLKLAERSRQRGDAQAFEYYSDNAVRHAIYASDRIDEAKAYRYMESCFADTDSSRAARYREMADSLSYEPYLRRMVGAVSFSTLEFARRERDQRIRIQRQRIILLIGGLTVIAIALILMTLLFRNRSRISRLQKEQIDSLKKNLEQKEKLLAIANAIVDPEVKKELSNAAAGIDLPVKLTSREIEIANLAIEGLLNKEIADRLGISTRTVETHRNNVYRKLDISNISELRYYMAKLNRR